MVLAAMETVLRACDGTESALMALARWDGVVSTEALMALAVMEASVQRAFLPIALAEMELVLMALAVMEASVQRAFLLMALAAMESSVQRA
jgi:hypothetical protein